MIFRTIFLYSSESKLNSGLPIKANVFTLKIVCGEKNTVYTEYNTYIESLLVNFYSLLF